MITRRKIRDYIFEHPLISFTLLTYVLTLLAAVLQNTVVTLFATSIFNHKYSTLLYTYCPAIASLILTYATDSTTGIKNLLIKLKPLKQYYWLSSATTFANLLILALVIQLITSEFLIGELFTFNFLMTYASLLLFQIVIVGIGEEIGWRGFLLDKALNSFSFVKSTLIVFMVWAVWHIPKLVILSDFVLIIALLLSLLAFSIGFTFFYIKQGGNLVFIILMHSSFNASIEAINLSVSANAITQGWLACGILYLIAFSFLASKSKK